MGQHRQHRSAKVAVEKRHRTRSNLSSKSIAHHQIVSFAKFFDICVDLRQIITIVRIGHNDESAFRSRDPSEQSAPIAAAGDIDDARPSRLSYFARAVDAAIVRDKYFPSKTGSAKCSYSLTDTRGNCF